MGQGSAVDEIQLATQRYAMGDTAEGQALGDQQLRDVVGGCFTFHGRVGGEDHFAERTCSDSRQQFRNTDGLRPETVEG